MTRETKALSMFATAVLLLSIWLDPEAPVPIRSGQRRARSESNVARSALLRSLRTSDREGSIPRHWSSEGPREEPVPPPDR